MAKLDELEQLIKEAKDAYYGSGKTIMSDSQYDMLVYQAEKLGYIETVGAEPVSELPKIKHEHLMLSLDKIHTQEEVDKFIGSRKTIAMYKADGLSISATYIDGVLTRLETRGNGDAGNDIMVHAKSFENLPLTINKSGRYVVDGECVILRDDFNAINAKLPEDNKYKNPRNLAAGSLNLLDPAVSATRKLRFYLWDVIEGGSYELIFDNLVEAEYLGFSRVRCIYDIHNSPMVAFDDLKKMAQEDGFPIDGIVLKYDDVSLRDKLGHTDHHFNNACAYKFEDEHFESVIRGCEYQVGKTGQLTPILVFDPVWISGSVVSRSSAHNISILKQLHPQIGCTCYVIKANDIIPQVDFCENDGDEEIEIPSTCPICGSPTEIRKDNESEVLYCTNPHCPGRSLGKFKHFVSRKGMDISGLSEETLKKFIGLGWIERFSDIYNLGQHYQEMINLQGFGKKSVDNLMQSIEESRHNVPLQRFITSLSIPGVGEGQSKAICRVYKTWQEFLDARKRPGSYISIEGIGPTIDSAIRDWFNEEDNMADASNIAAMLEFESAMNKPEGDFPLLDKTFVVTGKVMFHKNRDEIKEKIERLGGKVAGSVSKNTSFLINNDVDSVSGKNKKAKELGIPVISEEEFLRMTGEK